jgi:hypothetical protein
VLGPQDVGSRVVVRVVVRVSDQGRPQFTDILGILDAIDDRNVMITTDRGERRTVPVAAIAAAKPVPPKPPPRHPRHRPG